MQKKYISSSETEELISKIIKYAELWKGKWFSKAGKGVIIIAEQIEDMNDVNEFTSINLKNADCTNVKPEVIKNISEWFPLSQLREFLEDRFSITIP